MKNEFNLKSVDCLILCGGLGQRLRSTIGESQKVMAKVGGHPFLNLILTELKCQGLERVILLTGYQSQTLESYYRENNLGLRIEFSTETEPLGTGGAVKNAQRLVQSDHFLVFNGDSFCKLNLNLLLRFHLASEALATVAVSQVKDSKDFGSIVLDGEGRIRAFNEKVRSAEGFVNAGIYVFQKHIFEHFPNEKTFSIEKDFFPKLTGKEFYGFVTQEEFIDIGTPERYKKVQINFKG